jgi:hypothetical protein
MDVYGYGGFIGMGSMMQGWMAPISIIGIVSGIVIVISAVYLRTFSAVEINHCTHFTVRDQV